jgi:hypothetical protein
MRGGPANGLLKLETTAAFYKSRCYVRLPGDDFLAAIAPESPRDSLGWNARETGQSTEAHAGNISFDPTLHAQIVPQIDSTWAKQTPARAQRMARILRSGVWE